ncbi:RHS repeat-associated core domain-containing protein [Pseudodesulfovibrio thermohalotolerans]|uniref:RHS repeat domain-containing protein n=1 Tax=Pseudodesulfovibrio thermohalotolerans TaxID=2880651 RepID=UPI0022B9FAE6|nr:RHS repeat-associated core domain-containing protein [Pseudodesulfovibrio thermohalotolerans]WFS63399.1 RHS repeat-associated core domain-containing protein [Pseudodesulfovibrio thermohalotolerans]
MTKSYSYQLRRDRDGRIVEKTETVAGRRTAWKYAYDRAGRLTEAHLDGRLICQCGYDREGRRNQDYFPATVGLHYRDYRYTLDNRLLRAGNNDFTHDVNGFRSIWAKGGTYHLYEYAPDYRLLKMEVEDKDRVYTFDHDEDGQRVAKQYNGQLIEAYRWLDFVRLGGFHDGQHGFEFAYRDGERVPFAMRRDDGTVFGLFSDQVGSLRVVVDINDNVVKEIVYDPFGGIIEDTNPDFRIPIGFAGGLHDRDLGFVRFGWRDYDTFTSRWTAPDPIGDKGGDPDWYGYCLDDPVNGVDPLGLFRFGKRPLSFLPDDWHGISKDGSIADKYNLEPKHEQGFYEDGTGKNIGFGSEGKMTSEDISKYRLNDKQYDDKRMLRAYKSTTPGKYNAFGIGGDKNNCQDYADKLRKRYDLFDRGDKMR